MATDSTKDRVLIIGSKQYLLGKHGVKDALEEVGFSVTKMDRLHGAKEHSGFLVPLRNNSACFVDDWETIKSRIRGD